MSMKTNIVRCKLLTPSECDEMYGVFARYYVNADPVRFSVDLQEKDWVIQLRNEALEMVGFSTLQLYEHTGSAGKTMIIYSGDTIIDREYRLTGNLAGAFGSFLVRTIKTYPGTPVYWLLTTKGARTYRFPPVFFRTFHPVYEQQTPPLIQALMDEVAADKFGADYSPETQIVSHHGKRDWLRASEHDPMLLGRDDPHIRFFLERNPGYVQGDELVCLTEISNENLNARARRVIQHTEVQWRE
jgi:hypothetical protein